MIRKTYLLFNEEKENIKSKKPKETSKVLNFESFNVLSNNINLYIVKIKTDKVNINLSGFYIYLLNNNTHYQIEVELDFGGSINIQSEMFSINKTVKRTIEPFSLLNKQFLTNSDIEINPKCQICEIDYLYDYNVNLNIKYYINFPHIQLQKELIKQDPFNIYEYCQNKSMIDLLNKFKNYELTEIIINDIKDVETLLIEENLPYFVDSPAYFIDSIIVPLNDQYPYIESINSISKSNIKFYNKIAIHWRPLSELIPSDYHSLETSHISPLIINKSMIYDKKLISIISHLSEYPEMIMNIIKTSTMNQFGFYVLSFFINGSWVNTIVDGFIPCFFKSQPIFSYCENKSFWLSILIKGLIKVFNTFEEIQKLSVESIYKMLTGLPVITLNLSNSMKNILFHLQNYIDKQYLVSACHDSNSKYNKIDIYNDSNKEVHDYKIHKYLDESYTYPLLMIVNSNNLLIFIVRIFFLKEFKKKEEVPENDFLINDNSYDYLNDLHMNLEYYRKYIDKESLNNIINKYSEDSTILLLNQYEFFSYFNKFYITPTYFCYETYYRSRFVRVFDKNNKDIEGIISAHYIELTITEIQNIRISVGFNQNEYFKSYFMNNTDISFGLLNNISESIYEKFFVSDFQSNNVYEEFKIKPGKYILIARTTGIGFKKNPEKNKFFYDPLIKNSNNEEELEEKDLNNILKDIFEMMDVNCKNYLNYIQYNTILQRLQLPQEDIISEKEFNKLVNTYSYGIPGMNLNTFIKEMRQSLQKENSQRIFQILNNFGYDKHLFPFLNRLYSIQIFSEKEIDTRIKSNFLSNFDYILNNLIVKESNFIEKDREYQIVSERISSNIFIEGVKNINKKESKLITLDYTQTTGAFLSTNSPIISKKIGPGQSVFYLYLVIKNEELEPFKRQVKESVESINDIHKSRKVVKKIGN